MCLIIQKPAGADVPLDIIQSALDYNRDGVGVMANGGADRWVKIKATKLARKINALGSAAVHFRMATHGRIDHTNVHPFRAVDGTHIMHNGVLSKYAPLGRKTAAASDTQCFVREYIDPMLRTAGKLDLQAIANETAGNALALMATDGKIELTGESWVEYMGLRLSNTYAWDAPVELRAAWSYDIHDETISSDYLPVKHGADDRAAELEDILLSELCVRVDEIDFADAGLCRHFDTVDHVRLLSGDLSPEDFLENMNAQGLLACRLYLATHGDV